MSIYDYSVKKRDGSDFSLSNLKGKVMIIVNTATGCGFTPQYEGLEQLYQKYHDSGLEILDFPCNQFGHQAPGTNDEIHEFCQAKYQTSFDQFAKLEVNGDKEDSLYTYLKEQQPNEEVKGLKNKMAMKAIKKIAKNDFKDNDIHWNFTKFLVDKEGNVIKRYDPTFDPKNMEQDIEGII